MPSRALSETEIATILDKTEDTMHRTLLILGIRTGYRISELLFITMKDVFDGVKVLDSITVRRSNMKGKQVSRTVVLHAQAKRALGALIEMLLIKNQALDLNKAPLSSLDDLKVKCSKDDKLFPISRYAAHRIVKSAVKRAGLEGRISCHSMRKSFGMRVYEKTGKDIVAAQKALGHKSLASTSHYLDVNKDIVDAAILAD